MILFFSEEDYKYVSKITLKIGFKSFDLTFSQPQKPMYLKISYNEIKKVVSHIKTNKFKSCRDLLFISVIVLFTHCGRLTICARATKAIKLR